MGKRIRILVLLIAASCVGVLLGIGLTPLIAGAKKKPTNVGPSVKKSSTSNKGGGTVGPLATTPEEVAAQKAESDRLVQEDGEKKHLAYWGTQIKTNPKATGEELSLQQSIVAELNRKDFVPQVRLDYFSDVINQPDIDMRLNGWYGIILSTTPGPGGLLVKVRVAPYLSSRPASITKTTDHLIETYLMTDNGLEFVQAEKSETAHKALIRH